MEQPENHQSKAAFLTGLHVEMRTPLSGILGMADLLLETPLDEHQKEYVTAARTCAEDLLEQVNAALKFSALSSGPITLDEFEFNLRETLTSAAGQNRQRAREKGLNCRVVLEDGVPEAAVGEAVRLGEIVSQLVGDAVRFTSKGDIEVRASAGPVSNGHFELTIVVQSTGFGIVPQLLERAFQSLQSGGDLARRYPGLVLGLALAQTLVHALGGEMKVESGREDSSSTTFRVPLRVPGASPTALPPAIC